MNGLKRIFETNAFGYYKTYSGNKFKLLCYHEYQHAIQIFKAVQTKLRNFTIPLIKPAVILNFTEKNSRNDCEKLRHNILVLMRPQEIIYHFFHTIRQPRCEAGRSDP